MFNTKISILTMKVKPPKDWTAKFVWWTTQWTFNENDAQKSLIFFITLIFPPRNTFIMSTPKHNSFLDNSLFNIPPFIIKSTITLLKLLEFDSFWELESQWTFEFSENDYRGQNPLDWRIFYIIEKILNFRCLKWAHMTHLEIWNTSYGQKKG